jgi:aerobic carbon-monoxide dehydrogenase large subunit
VKGLGDGGAIALPAAIADAVGDAFRDIRANFNETPLTPRRAAGEVARARAKAKG